MFTPNDLIDIAAKMEKNGETVYLEAKKKVDSRTLKSLLQWMADEEAAHRKWFLEQKETRTSSVTHTDLETMLPDVIKKMMGDKTLSLDDVDFSQIRSASDMLDTFVTFENDTILFYEFLQAFIQDTRALSGLEKIIKEERNHVEKLTDMIHDISSKNNKRPQ